MRTYDELRQQVGFDAEDEALLRQCWPRVEAALPWLCDRFYERILQTPATRRVLRHESQVASLKETLAHWIRELMTGPYDQRYCDRRRKIGVRHVDVGLPVRFMLTSMGLLTIDMGEVAAEGLDADEAHRVRVALRKVTDLDMALITGTFIAESEHRQMSSFQELLVAHLPVAALLFDANDRVTASTAMAGMLVTEPEVIGRRWYEVLPEKLIQNADLRQVVGRAVDCNEMSHLARVDAEVGEAVRSFGIHVVPLEKTEAHVLLYFEDLSAAVEIEARVGQAEALAKLGALSAAVAHEIRNPLAGMSAALQVLRATFDDNDDRGEVVTKIQNQVGRLGSLMDDLLTFARPTHSEPRSVSLKEVAQSAAELSHTGAAGLSIEIVGDGRAMADPNLLQQILLNLVHNAVQAVAGDGRVEIRVDDHCVAVEDDGPGVPEAERRRIFQPFMSTKTRGTGLGLAISRRAATAMGATLTVGDSSLGGAAFMVEWPERDVSM